MLVDLLIIAAASAFVVSFAERWLPDNGLYRGAVAFLSSVAGLLVLGYDGWSGVVYALAAAYTALIMILVGERLATPPPIAIDPRRR